MSRFWLGCQRHAVARRDGLPTIRMMIVKRLTCLWPGLPKLWYSGGWSGLLTACAFGALVNGLIASSLLWPEVAPTALRMVALSAAILWWITAGILALRDLPALASDEGGAVNQGLFGLAQTEYLKGNWIEAEAHLRRLLRKRPHDVESLLLLATLQRRTNRGDQARQQLQQLSRLEAAKVWQVEIRCERELLRRDLERRRMKQIEETEQPAANVFALHSADQESTANDEQQPQQQKRPAA